VGAKKKTRVGLSVFSFLDACPIIEFRRQLDFCYLFACNSHHRCADMDLWLLRVGIANKDIDDTNRTEHPMICNHHR
jgi:hypothetical protein